jgi:hypothetical protein
VSHLGCRALPLVGLVIMAAGCEVTVPRGSSSPVPAPLTPPGGSVVTPAPSDLRFKGACPVSRAEAEAALGGAVDPPQGDYTRLDGCQLGLADHSGGIVVGVEFFSSARLARYEVDREYQMSDHCCASKRIPDLGQDAALITGTHPPELSLFVAVRKEVLVLNVVSAKVPVAAAVAVALARKVVPRI